jgi:hypothetical protein
MTAISPVLAEEFVPKEVVYAKDQPEYQPLPVLKNRDGVLLSRWSLTEQERAAIAAGADIFLMNWTFHQPLQPVRMEVGECDRDIAGMAAFMGLLESEEHPDADQ